MVDGERAEVETRTRESRDVFHGVVCLETEMVAVQGCGEDGTVIGNSVQIGGDNGFAAVAGDQFTDGVEGKNPAVVDDGYPVAQPLSFFHVVGRVDDRAALFFEFLDFLENKISRLRIDADGGFVEQQDGRVVDERAAEVEPSLHSAGEGLYAVVAAVGQSDEIEDGGDAFAQHSAGQAVEAAEEAEIFVGGEVIVQCDGLR